LAAGKGRSVYKQSKEVQQVLGQPACHHDEKKPKNPALTSKPGKGKKKGENDRLIEEPGYFVPHAKGTQRRAAIHGKRGRILKSPSPQHYVAPARRCEGENLEKS